MKKVFSMVLALALALIMCVSVCAAPGGFVSSPSGNGAPTIIAFEPLSPDCTMQLIVTAYKDRDTLPEDERARIEKAYDDIANATDLTELWKEVADLAKENKVSGSQLAVSDLFHVHGEGCDDHDGHNGFKVTLDAATLENYFALMQMDENGNWSMVEGAYINDKGQLVFTLIDEPVDLAIVVKTDHISPPMGENIDIYVYGALMLVSALAIVLLVVKSKKYA